MEKSAVDNAKLALMKKGKILSNHIENSLHSLSTPEILEKLCKEIIIDCGYINREKVEKKRPDLKGNVCSELAVREMRNERV